MTSPMATTNSGSAVTASAMTDRTLSSQPSRRAAARMPSATPMTVPMSAGEQHEDGGVDDARPDEMADGVAVGERVAEIALEHAGDPAPSTATTIGRSRWSCFSSAATLSGVACCPRTA